MTQQPLTSQRLGDDVLDPEWNYLTAPAVDLEDAIAQVTFLRPRDQGRSFVAKGDKFVRFQQAADQQQAVAPEGIGPIRADIASPFGPYLVNHDALAFVSSRQTASYLAARR